MMINNFLKKKALYLLGLWFVISFSCTSGAEKTPDQDISQNDFQIPKLEQQEILPEKSSDMVEYALYNSIMEEGPIIPGIFQSAVPQGMAYSLEEDLMFVSNYMYDGRPSCITVVSMADRKLLKTLWLLNPDGSPHLGHVGGLAISKKHLWIASGKGVYYISLETVQEQNDNSNITMEEFVPTVVQGSFAGFSDGILWVGEFTSRDGSYSTPKSHHFKTKDKGTNHAWLAGFILYSESDMINLNHKIGDVSYPDYILSIPDEIQGVTFINDKILLSRSYGRKNNSRISVFRDIRKDLPDTTVILENGGNIPVWILDLRNFEMEIVAPPMTEGIVNYKGSAAVLFESGSDKYRATAKNPQDRIQILNINY